MIEGESTRRNGWSKARQRDFLGHLAASLNVRSAARACGMDASGAYRLRRRDPVFAEGWRLAVSEGLEALEGALAARAAGATEAAADMVTPPQIDPAAIDPELSLQLLKLRQGARQTGVRPKAASRRPSEDEVMATLKRHLESLAKRLIAGRA